MRRKCNKYFVQITHDNGSVRIVYFQSRKEAQEYVDDEPQHRRRCSRDEAEHIWVEREGRVNVGKRFRNGRKEQCK